MSTTFICLVLMELKKNKKLSWAGRRIDVVHRALFLRFINERKIDFWRFHEDSNQQIVFIFNVIRVSRNFIIFDLFACCKAIKIERKFPMVSMISFLRIISIDMNILLKLINKMI